MHAELGNSCCGDMSASVPKWRDFVQNRLTTLRSEALSLFVLHSLSGLEHLVPFIPSHVQNFFNNEGDGSDFYAIS